MKDQEELTKYLNQVLIRGEGNHPPLRDEVHAIASFVAFQKRLGWLLLSAILVDILGAIITGLVFFLQVLPDLQRLHVLLNALPTPGAK